MKDSSSQWWEEKGGECMFILSITTLILFSSGVASPEPLWAEDELVWDMTTNTTWIGYGYTYCDAVYDQYTHLYAAAIVDGAGKDTLMICRYIIDPPDSGYWDNMVGIAASVLLTDPVISLSSFESDDFINFFYIAEIGEKGMIQGMRLLLPDFTFSAILFPDWSNPLADQLRSIEVVSLVEGSTQWVFADDVNNRLFLTKSEDAGSSWTPSELVAENVTRPTASAGPGDRVYVSYQETVGENAIKCLIFDESGVTETTVGAGAVNSAPIPIAEWQGPQNVGIVFHDQNNNVRLTISYDFGISWSIPQTIGEGIYPFADIFPGTNRVCLAYIDVDSAAIRTSAATGLIGLPGADYEIRSDHAVSMAGPPVVRYSLYGTFPGIYALFYLGPGPSDLWFDATTLTGVESVSGIVIGQLFLDVNPNPSRGELSISFGLGVPDHAELGIYSLDGRLVESIFSGTAAGGTYLAGSGLPAGIYSVVLRTNGEIITQRFVRL